MSVQSKLDALLAAREDVFRQTTARKRLGLLFDADSFVELDGFAQAGDSTCGVVCGHGTVMGNPACAFAQEGGAPGAMSRAGAAKIAKLLDLALKTGVPVVGIYDSYGARAGEGVGILSAFGELLLRVNNLSGVVPQISLVLGDCAGSSALLACSADFVVMCRDAAFFLTPPGLAQDSDGKAGSADNAAKAGVAHIVADDEENACAAVRKLLSRMPLNNLAAAPALDFSPPADTAPLSQALDFDDMPGKQIAASICDADALELLPGFGGAAYTALATLSGNPAGIVATQGKLDADSCAKIAKLVSVCDAFQIPVVTFVNTTGFVPSAKAELSGCAREMARLAHVYAEATTAKLSVVTGRAYGAAYVALASRAVNSDYTVAWPGAVISPLEPAAAVALLYSDRITADNPRDAVEKAYEENEASALSAARDGHIDDVIPPELTRPALISAIILLAAKRVSRNPKKHSNIPM